MSKHNNSDDNDIYEIDDFDSDEVQKNIERIKKKKRKKKKKMSGKKKAVIIVIVAVLVVLALAFAFVAKRNVSYMKGRANDLKANLTVTFDCIRNGDPDGAENAMVTVRDIADNIDENLGFTFWKVMSYVPVVSGDIASVKEMLNILDEADEAVIMPFIDQTRQYPLSEIKSGGGINTNIVSAYLDFADSIAPAIIVYSERMSDIDFKIVKFKSFDEYIDKFADLSKGLKNLDDFKALLGVLCGNGEDKTFLMMAQNTAEIRSCGGFPGACGLIEVKDGILKVESFGPVENYIAYGSTPGNGITDEETAVFGQAYSWQDRDASYNPHFPKVASITKNSYETLTGKTVDGVVSLTPEIIQDILAITGETLILDDGTTVNGENASMTLQHDLYYKYYPADEGFMTNDELVNALFAQTATLAMDSMTRNMSFDSLVKFIAMFEDGFADRTIMVWAEDADDENVLMQVGASGSLNFDAEKPQTGIFFSNSIASKMGMFVDIDYELGEAVANASGGSDYQMKVVIKNTASAEDLNVGSYVKGNREGEIVSSIFLFAPMGGSISNVVYDNGVETNVGNIYGLDVAFVNDMGISPGESITITYTVSTAAGVTAPLQVVKTPTLQ